jgi:hypothetical protein
VAKKPRDALAGLGPALIQLGLVLLLATPLLRVVSSLAGFALQRDRVYVAVTLIVLGILLYGLLGGWVWRRAQGRAAVTGIGRVPGRGGATRGSPDAPGMRHGPAAESRVNVYSPPCPPAFPARAHSDHQGTTPDDHRIPVRQVQRTGQSRGWALPRLRRMAPGCPLHAVRARRNE